MSERERESERGAWFDDFGPMHDVWIRFERGMQILLGVALITMFGFLGESWGGENIPYQNIMKAIYRVSWAFAISIMTSPIILAIGMVARRYLPYSRRTRGRLYLIALVMMLFYCWSMLYVSVIDVIESLVAATGVENPYP